MQPLSQRDSKWANIKLGNGVGTIGDYGCTITALACLLGTTPIVVNDKLKANGGFGGTTKNLVVWSALSKAFPQIISAERITSYDNEKVKQAIEKNGGCLVEVDGTRIGASRHWVLYIGNQEMIDPWTGVIKATSYYPPVGCAIINIKSMQETITQEQWQIERDERNKNWELYQDQLEVVKKLKIEIEGLNRTITEIKLNQDKEVISLKKTHSEFVENLLTTLNGSNPLGLSSEELTVKLVQEAISKETSLQAEIKALQQTTDKEKADLIKENKDLKEELERLKKEFAEMTQNHQIEIDGFKSKLDNVQAQFEENQEEVIKIDSWKTFIEALIKIFRKDK